MKSGLIIFFICTHFLSTSVFGQSQLSGHVTDAETGEPIFGANVFIENSTVGSTSDPDGKYIIRNIRGAFQNVVVSHAAYVNQVVPLNGRSTLNFTLNPNTRVLSDFELEESRDRKWRRYYKQFEEAFIGQSENAEKVVIQNPWAMELSKSKSDELFGYSFDLLEIDNLATGYHIKFLVESFNKAGTETSYGGKPLFIPLETDDLEQQQEWEENRRKTYLGSKQHFLYALANNRVSEEGFQLYNAEFSQKFGHFITLDPAQPEEVFKDGIMNFEQFLKIVYTKEKPEDAFTRAYRSTTTLDMSTMRGGGSNVSLRNRQDFNNQVSYLFLRSSKGAKITEDGFLTNPKVLLEYGYWSWERVAELLPYEYHLDFNEPQAKPEPTELPEQREEVILKNGFNLSDSQIASNKIYIGAPSRNAIPSIDQPQFEITSTIDWLKDSDDLLVVTIDNKTKAYPIQILNRHEVVNDLFDDRPIAITYCPLCASGLAFDRVIDDQALSFGVSGLLYYSNVLLYDQQTNSLWSQIMSEAISGPMKGKNLEPIPVTRMKWSEWKKTNAQDLVLSRKTGFNFDYGKAVYVGYDKTQQIPFPVESESRELKNKEMVIGISINGEHKAYPLKKLKKKPLTDELGGTKITVRYSKENQSATIADSKGNIIPSLMTFWFAWHAFHPSTKIFD